MTCPQCGRPHEAGSKFCRGCGARVESATDGASTCATCHAPLKPGARFCKQCGTASTVSPTSAASSAIIEVATEPRVEAVEPLVAFDASPEAPRVQVSSERLTETGVPRQKPEGLAGKGPSRGIVIAAAVVLAVVVVGGLVTWGLLRKGNVATPVVVATAPTPASAANANANVASDAQAPAAPPAMVARAIPVEAAPAAPPTPVMVAVAAPPPVTEAPRTTIDASPKAPLAPVEKPARAKRMAAPVDTQAPMQEVALNLVRKGESAFSRQDYSTAIANARAALDVSPGLMRAKQLLNEAQRAQQHAMNSISIQ